jgi:hypothetical protein
MARECLTPEFLLLLKQTDQQLLLIVITTDNVQQDNSNDFQNEQERDDLIPGTWGSLTTSRLCQPWIHLSFVTSASFASPGRQPWLEHLLETLNGFMLHVDCN